MIFILIINENIFSTNYLKVANKKTIKIIKRTKKKHLNCKRKNEKNRKHKESKKISKKTMR